MNRLGSATSPYLLQHKDNPVDWWEWSEDAFAEARRLDRPILLSVGYAACHWCHVMAHESFEDDATAALMNARFVNIKVDREERPDVDAVYMAATQALTGRGGWPMTVLLTHDGAPFFAGTYFPATPRPGAPAFTQVLDAVTDAWQHRRDELEDAGRRIAQAVSRSGPVADPGRPAPDDALVTEAVRALAADEDRVHGGLGGAPKFPPSMDLEFLLRHAARRRLQGPPDAGGTAEAALDVAARTLRAMAHSGMYDQVAGGFARYAVDAAWVVPHFEKMLYDNAQLAAVYLHWWRLTGEPTGARIALETCDWMLAALRTPGGGLASSLDADTVVPGGGAPGAAGSGAHGVEGLTYVWTPDQLAGVLPDGNGNGVGDAAWAARLLRVTPSGTFEHGSSTLQLDRDVWADPGQAARWQRIRAALARERARRPQPTRDDKVVAAWNGLAVAALAETGALLERPDLVTAAEQVAEVLLGVHLDDAPDGARLRRVSRDGRAGRPHGVLEDYGDVVHGLLVLHVVTGSGRWLAAAGALLDTVLGHFAGADGELFDTADFATDAALTAVRRPQDPTDGAYPSGTSAAAGALLGYAALTGTTRHRDAAQAALGVAVTLAGRAPRAFGWALATIEALLDGPREVALVGVPGSADLAALHRVALAGTAPGRVVSVGEPDAVGVPLLAGRPAVGGHATAYVCRGFVCDAPTMSPDVLATALGAPVDRGAAVRPWRTQPERG